MMAQSKIFGSKASVIAYILGYKLRATLVISREEEKDTLKKRERASAYCKYVPSKRKA